MSKKKKLSSILAESYAVYFEFIGIIISWLLIAYLLFNDFPDVWTFTGLTVICLSGYYVFRRELILKNLKRINIQL